MSRLTSFSIKRREQKSALLNLTLTDLLLVVLFVLLFFTFRAEDEGKLEISALQQRFNEMERERDRLRSDLAEARVKISNLEKKNAELEEFIQRLLKDKAPSNLDPRAIILKLEGEISSLKGELAQKDLEIKSRDAILNERQKEIADLGRRLTAEGKGGTGFPNCLITSAYLLEITLLENGSLKVDAAWDAGAEQRARAVFGINELLSGKEMSVDDFSRQGARVASWGNQQETPCRFRVRTTVQTTSLDTYRRQLRAIDRWFYPTR